MLLRRTLIQLALCTMLLAGCISPTPISLTDKQFRLIKLTIENIEYMETICQFGADKVEIWRDTDARKWYASLTVGGYSVSNKRLKLPFGEFETIRAKDGYYLYANGVLKYKMVINGGML